jgi:hypothetical protein
MIKERKKKKTLSAKDLIICRRISCKRLQSDNTCQPFGIATSPISYRVKTNDMEAMRPHIPKFCPRRYGEKYMLRKDQR